MNLVSLAALALSFPAASALAQPAPEAAGTPATQLAVPPADAQHFTILSPAGRHGDAEEWTAAVGTLMGRMHMVLRGQVWDQDEAMTLGRDGAVASYRLRGTSPNGDVGETFAVENGTARWKSQVDGGSAPYARPAFYLPAGNGVRAMEPLTERLVANPETPVAMLPGGSAVAHKLATTSVGQGAARMDVVLWSITGIAGTPFTVYTDASGKFFANAGVISVVRAGYEADVPALIKLQDTEIAKQSPMLARTLATVPAGPIAFTDVRAFVDGGRFAEHQTVVITNGRITAVGPAASTLVPTGARRIAGAGKTLVPGL